MIKLQNGNNYIGEHGDKQAVMDLLVAFTKKKGHEVTRQEVLDEGTMPHPNTIGSYFDGGFDNAVKKAHSIAFSETTTQQKPIEKKEKPPLTREEILKKVSDACFQHGDSTGWINDTALRPIVPLRDVYKAFSGGIKELKKAVKDVLYEQKHPQKVLKEEPPLVQQVNIPKGVLDAVAKEKPAQQPEPELTQEAEPIQEADSTQELEETDGFSIDDIEGYEVVENLPEDAEAEGVETEAVEPEVVEPETAEPEIAEQSIEVESVEEPIETEALEPKEVKEPEEVATTSAKEVNKVAKEKEKEKLDVTKMTDQEIADLYYEVCKKKGYIMNQRECLEYSKTHPFPSWNTLVNRLGNWWGWGDRFDLPYKTEEANEKARKYIEEQTAKQAKEQEEPAEQTDMLPDKELVDSDVPQVDNAPAPAPNLAPDPNLGPSLSTGTKEFTYPIKVTLPEGMTGTISFHMDIDLVIKV